MSIKNLFLETITTGLQRKSITTCSRWSEQYRVMGNPYPGKWSFKYFPWLKDMHDAESETNIGQKSAQMGFTETVLNIAFYTIDIKTRDVLYVLPAKTPDAGDFSSARFDAALELSPHLENLFSDVRNIGHKRAGSTNFYIRGSRSRSGLKSVPVGLIILDEVDEMTHENIPLAFERTSGQLEKYNWLISTPTLDNVGINKYFQLSSQNHFFFRCPSCNRFTEFKWPDSLVICGDGPNDPRHKDSHLICYQCKNILNHKDKVNFLANNKWIESYTDRDSKGWHISQMYSSTVSPVDIAIKYFAAQNDYTDEQELYNSKLGLVHEVQGARVTDAQIDAAKGNYTKFDKYTGSNILTMGVDVGSPWLHCEIVEWFIPSGAEAEINAYSTAKIIWYGKVLHFEQLDDLMRQFRVSFCVIDAHPERRKAYEFSQRWPGSVRLCFYVTGLSGKQLHVSDAVEPTVSVDRTSWLDCSLGRFRASTIKIPRDVDHEWRKQIKEQVRIYKKDKQGNPIGVYENVNADHYAHARNYSEIALLLATGIGRSQSMRNIL